MIKRILGVKAYNVKQIVYPKQKITKLNVLKYYLKIAPLMLTHIEDRLLCTVKCNKSINDECFFTSQLTKASPHLKPFKNNNKLYYYITSQKGIITEVANNTLMFYSSTFNVNKINNPNVMVFNLTTKKLNFCNLKLAAKIFKQTLDKLNLTSFIKTNGINGYDIIIPLYFNASYENIKKIATNIKNYMQKIYFSLFKTPNEIFINYLSNNLNSVFIAPYSLILTPNATISFPICWHNIDIISPNQITIKNYKKYLRKNNWQDFNCFY